ncbi:MAG: potassium channel family protein [Phycisphaerales bacterium]|nr:potassium channel family protein [Phycisphaerales bacterium]
MSKERRFNFSLESAISKAIVLCVLVVLTGTFGFEYIEGWSAWDSFFFTLYTLTTVGYDDAEISKNGQFFTAFLMIGGIGSVSYAISHIVQYAAAKAVDTEKKMISKASKLSGHCIVCGLGRTGLHIIRRLDDQAATVVAIDPDEELIQAARDRGIIAIRGDATQDKALIDAGIKSASSIAAATSSDATNALICLTAKALAPEIPIAARAEDEDSISKLSRAGAQSVISPTRYSGDSIADSMLHPMIADVIYGSVTQSSNKLHFREIPITDDNKRSGRTISDIIGQYQSVAYIASRKPDQPFTMRPPTDHVMQNGDFLLIAGHEEDLAAIEFGAFAQLNAAA